MIEKIKFSIEIRYILFIFSCITFILQYTLMTKRIIIGLMTIAVLSYLGYLIAINASLTASSTRNYISYLLIGLMFLYLLYFYVINPKYIKRHKLIIALIWLFLVIYSQYMFFNDIQAGIYYQDIFKVIWVVLVFLSPTKLRNLDKIEQQKEETDIEIVEV